MNNNMNIIKKIIFIPVVALLMLNSCSNDKLTDLNTDPTAANEIDPGFILAYTQLTTSGERYENWRAVLIYQSTMMQHFATTAGYWAGDKYTENRGYASSLWERAYRNYIKDLSGLIEATDPTKEGNEDMVNYHSIARIWKVFGMSRLTDLYGDVPYSEAGSGFSDLNFNPKYDSQQSIYADMLNELEEAAIALDDTKPSPEGQDLIYSGDISKWEKFSYSLMLRLGMRMTKVAASDAQQWVERAIAGGVMTSNDDICYISHTNGPDGINKNGIGEVFNWDGTSFTTDDNPRLSKYLVDWMTSTNDPRLAKMSWRVGVDGTGGLAKGLPNGFDATTIQDDASWPTDPDPNDDFDEMDDYSRINPLFVLNESPMIFQTYSEVAFLLAEAVERGWHSGDAATLYADGVRAAMKQNSLYDATLAIDDVDIDAYLLANPYNGAEWQRILGEQYWLATFLNEYETFSNWRRTGYPTLTPVNYPGNVTSGTIPRRLVYPTNEVSLNPDNYAAAIAAQGPDEFTTRVWWDVQ